MQIDYQTLLEITKDDERLLLVRDQLLEDFKEGANNFEGGYAGEDDSPFCKRCSTPKPNKLYCELCMGKFWAERKHLMLAEISTEDGFLRNKSLTEIKSFAIMYLYSRTVRKRVVNGYFPDELRLM